MLNLFRTLPSSGTSLTSPGSKVSLNPGYLSEVGFPVNVCFIDLKINFISGPHLMVYCGQKERLANGVIVLSCLSYDLQFAHEHLRQQG